MKLSVEIPDSSLADGEWIDRELASVGLCKAFGMTIGLQLGLLVNRLGRDRAAACVVALIDIVARDQAPGERGSDS